MLTLDRASRVVDGQERVGFGIPRLIIDTVQDPAELRLVFLQHPAEAESAVPEQRLVGMVGGDRGHRVGVYDPAFHRIEAAVAEVVTEPVGVQEIVGPAEVGSPQHPFVAGALMPEIMDGVADLLARQRRRGRGLFPQQDRDQACLPVVTVDDIGALTGVQEEFDGRGREEREPLRVVGVPVHALPAEEIR